MPQVMFTISYSVKPEKRDSYLQHVQALKEHLTSLGRTNYSVYEVKGKRNHFTEVFLSASMEDFDALEDGQDEKTEELIRQIEGFVDKGGMKYSTMIEAA
jgi:hypothetical protein